MTGHRGIILSLAFSPDGSRLVTAGLDRTAVIWDARSGKLQRTLTGHTSPVNKAAFSRDGQRVATASWDRSAKIWDAVTGEPLQL